MAGNFRGVLISVIFVVDLQSRKFPLPKINDYVLTREVAKNIVEVRPPALCV
jgi:hypothetical protein